MKKLVLAIIALTTCAICAPAAFASQNTISTFFETGERSVTDTIEDRDISGNYNFYRFFGRFDQEASKVFKYNISYEYYFKDYGTSDSLDMDSNQVRAGLDYWLFPERFKVSLDAGYKSKDYKNSPSSEYDRSNATLGLDYKYEESWSIGWDNGFINYDYDKVDNDQLKMLTKLRGWVKLFDERFKIAPSFKYQRVDNDNSTKDRAEQVFAASAYYKLNLPHFEKISGYYGFGKNDTKDSEDDDRDDDLRFKYQKWHVSTDHPLMEKLDTSFKYGQNRRNYQNSANNYRTWFIENKTDFTLYKDKIKNVKLSIPLEHREGEYSLVHSLSYIKNLIGARLAYKIKDNWELIPAVAFKEYIYHANPPKSEKDYEAKIEFSKSLPKNLDLNLSYKYVYKNYKQKPDITLWTVRAGIDWAF
jgi:hypothetical protein